MKTEELKGATHWNNKRKIHVETKPKQGFIAKAVRLFYSDLANAKNNDPEYENACKFASRCYQKHISNEFEEPSKKRFRESGAGRKAEAPEVREALFDWFIDVRGALKARLPRKLFLLKCHELYDEWLTVNDRLSAAALIKVFRFLGAALIRLRRLF